MAIAKPFLKWAGGKTQLIEDIKKSLPKNFSKTEVVFIEPFVGSGAVMFWMLSKYPSIKKVVINDINSDLINTYDIIKTEVEKLIIQLQKWETEYHKFKNDADARKEYYYQKRELFNTREVNFVKQAALFIFLNRTCFNGLFRVNKKNLFNVPIGSYKTPMICDELNLREVNKALQKVIILNGDYTETLKYAENNSFFYFDPPYKPLSETSSFNSYAKDDFNDLEQIRLKNFCATLNEQGYNWMLSNSDVKGKDSTNNFFDDLYASYNITRVNARRNINAHASKRGKLTELLITNQVLQEANLQ